MKADITYKLSHERLIPSGRGRARPGPTGDQRDEACADPVAPTASETAAFLGH